MFSLARFAYRFNGATIHFSHHPGTEEPIHCAINVSVNGRGLVFVRKSASTVEEAINEAAVSIESKVACRVDWRSWFTYETFASWLIAIGQPFRWLLGQNESRSYAN